MGRRAKVAGSVRHMPISSLKFVRFNVLPNHCLSPPTLQMTLWSPSPGSPSGAVRDMLSCPLALSNWDDHRPVCACRCLAALVCCVGLVLCGTYRTCQPSRRSFLLSSCTHYQIRWRLLTGACACHWQWSWHRPLGSRKVKVRSG